MGSPGELVRAQVAMGAVTLSTVAYLQLKFKAPNLGRASASLLEWGEQGVRAGWWQLTRSGGPGSPLKNCVPGPPDLFPLPGRTRNEAVNEASMAAKSLFMQHCFYSKLYLIQQAPPELQK